MFNDLCSNLDDRYRGGYTGDCPQELWVESGSGGTVPLGPISHTIFMTAGLKSSDNFINNKSGQVLKKN